MSKPQIYKKITKPRLRPTEVEPWFTKYLSESELKVLTGILSMPIYADGKYKRGECIAPNKIIAFYANVKTTNTISAIKKRLIRKGVIEVDEIIEDGVRYSYVRVDLEWNKDKYIAEFDAEYADCLKKLQKLEKSKEEMVEELEKTIELIKDEEISEQKTVDKVKSILGKLETKVEQNKHSNCEIPIEDVEAVAEHYVTKKVTHGSKSIDDKRGYKNTIVKLIKDGSFENIQTVYKTLHLDEIETINSYVHEIYMQDKKIITHNNEKLEFIRSVIREENDTKVFKLKYNYINKNESIEYYLNQEFIYKHFPPEQFTKLTQKVVENYAKFIKKKEFT
jgi:predicted transcriptional regulator